MACILGLMFWGTLVFFTGFLFAMFAGWFDEAEPR